MLTKDQASTIFARLKKLSTADEMEVLFFGGKSALTRFANNTIHQNVAEENHGVSVRTVFAGRTARATTNKFDDASLQRVVQASEALAKVQHPDPDLLPLFSGSENKSISPTTIPSRTFESTLALTPETRAQAVELMIGIAKRHKLTAAGIFANSESIEGIFNSRGVAQWHTQTSSDISVTMLAADSSGWQKSNSPDASNLDARELAQTAAQKELDNQKRINQQMLAIQKEQQELEKKTKEIQARIDAIKKLRESQQGPTALLQEIKARFDAVPGLYLTSVENKDGEVTIKGLSPNEYAVTKFGQSLEFSNGLFSNLNIETTREAAKLEAAKQPVAVSGQAAAVKDAVAMPEVIAFTVKANFGSKPQSQQPAPAPAGQVAMKK